jgi:hypothetical protein
MNNTILVLILLTVLVACEDDRVPSGIEADVFFAPCDSFPVFEEYNGLVYFVPVTKISDISDSIWDSVKTKYPSAMATDGYLCFFLDPGNYIGRPDTFRNSLPDQVLTIEPDLLQKAELKFMNCR